MLRKNQILFFVFSIGIFLKLIVSLLYQMDMREVYEDDASFWYSKYGFVADLLITLGSILSFIKYWKFFPKVIRVSYPLLISLILFASFEDLNEVLSTPSILYSPKGIGTWLNSGILFFMADIRYRNKLINLFKPICYFLILFNIIQLAGVGAISSRTDALFAIRDTTIILIWCYSFFFLIKYQGTSRFGTIYQYVSMAIIMIFAIAIASRSYIAIVLFLIFLKIKFELNSRNIPNYFFAFLFLIIGGFYFLLINSELYSALEGMTNILMARAQDDSRSSQLLEFYSQYDFSNILMGEGPLATWNWSGSKTPYQWLDNQYILIAWWFGLPTLVVYLIVVFYPIFKKNYLKDPQLRAARIILIFWFLACAGLAIYVTISTKLFYVFILLMLGLLSCRNREELKIL